MKVPTAESTLAPTALSTSSSRSSVWEATSDSSLQQTWHHFAIHTPTAYREVRNKAKEQYADCSALQQTSACSVCDL